MFEIYLKPLQKETFLTLDEVGGECVCVLECGNYGKHGERRVLGGVEFIECLDELYLYYHLAGGQICTPLL